MFSFRQLFRYKPVEEPGKRGGFLERLLTVVTSALQVIIIMVPEVIMVVVVVLILVMMVMIVMVVVILVGLDSEAYFQRWAFVCDDDGGNPAIKGRPQLKKNVFFRALSESPKLLTPIWATWSFFFRKSKFKI